MSKILNRPQAEAIASAMCALNNVSGLLEARMGGIRVKEGETGRIFVFGVNERGRAGPIEVYATQSEFAASYGLESGSSAPVAQATPTTRELNEDDAIERFNASMSDAINPDQRRRACNQLAKSLGNKERARNMHDAWMEQARESAREARQ